MKLPLPIFLWALFLLTTNNVFCQKIDVKWGEVGQQFLSNPDEANFVKMDAKDLDAIGVKFKTNTNMYKTVYGKTQAYITKSHVYYPYFETTAGVEKLYLQETDQQGKLKGGLKLLSSDPYTTDGPKANYNGSEPGLFISKNKELILRVTLSGLYSKPIPEKITFTVWDENLKIKWTKQQQFTKYSDVDFGDESERITDDGQVILVARIEEKQKAKKGDIIYKRSVFFITRDNMKEVEVSLGEERIPNSAELTFLPDNKLAITGSYRNANNSYFNLTNNGRYVMIYDIEKGVILSKSVLPYDISLFPQKHPSAKDIAFGIKSIHDPYILELKNGNFVLLSSYGSNADNVYGANALVTGLTAGLDKQYETVVRISSCVSHLEYPHLFGVNNQAVLVYGNCEGPPIKYTLRATFIDEQGKVMPSIEIPYEGKDFDLRSVKQLSDNKLLLETRPHNDFEYEQSGHVQTNFKQCIVTFN